MCFNLEYGEEISYNIKLLSEVESKYLYNFCCGNKEIDKYLLNDALEDLKNGQGVTKVFIKTDDPEIIGFYTICCSSIVVEDHSKSFFYPSVEIKMFAVNEKYQNMQFTKDIEDGVLSDYLLCSIIKDINIFTEKLCGAGHITLYSVKDAETFYERNGFENFKKYMKQNDDRYLDGCIPMFFKL